MKKAFLIILLICISFGSYKYFIKDYLHTKSTKELKNILIVSFCSVDSLRLPYFNNEIDKTTFPELSKILSESYYYTNAISSTSWLNLMFYIARPERNETYPENKFNFSDTYQWQTDYADIYVARHPSQRFPKSEYLEYYLPNRDVIEADDIKKLTLEMNKFFSSKQSPNRKIYMIHFKLMHYPLLSEETLSSTETLNSIFTKKQIELISRYLKNPNTQGNKLPFLQYMFGKKIIRDLFINKNKEFELYLLSNTEINKWKKSENYLEDMDMLKRAYDFKLQKMNKLIGSIYQEYLKHESNTILVLTGDHGESLAKRNFLSHAFVPFDETIKFFFSIHFPFQDFGKNITEQTSQRTIGELVQDLAKGKLSKYNFEKDRTRGEKDSLIFSYSCTGDFISIRERNKWKFIYDLKNDDGELFDLENDPNELINLKTSHNDLFYKFKIIARDKLSNRTLDDFKCIN